VGGGGTGTPFDGWGSGVALVAWLLHMLGAGTSTQGPVCKVAVLAGSTLLACLQACAHCVVGWRKVHWITCGQWPCCQVPGGRQTAAVMHMAPTRHSAAGMCDGFVLRTVVLCRESRATSMVAACPCSKEVDHLHTVWALRE
jgi:hypothetical protein